MNNQQMEPLHNLLIIENPDKLYIVENESKESTVDSILRQPILDLEVTDSDLNELDLLELRWNFSYRF
jgi:hypothetical protein